MQGANGRAQVAPLDAPGAVGGEPDGPRAFYRGLDGLDGARDAQRQQARVLERLQSLNPFKKGKVGGGWFNPEDFTQQKREWARQFGGDGAGSEAHKLFESFFIAGLPPSTDIKSVTADAQTAKTARQDHVPMRFAREARKEAEHRGSKGQPLPAQVLFSYPPDKPVSGEVAAFCFPHGVQPTLLERTPSMSALNEVLYSQRFLHAEGASFVFLMKVAGTLPLYGICCCMEELLHRPPALLADRLPAVRPPLSRHLVSAPRCYCFLTHRPFFSLHLKVLHMIMGLERLERITSFAAEQEQQQQQQQQQQQPRAVPESPFGALPPPGAGNSLRRRSGSAGGGPGQAGSRPASSRSSPAGPVPEPRPQAAVAALAAAIKGAASATPADRAALEGLAEVQAQGLRHPSLTAAQPPAGSRPGHRKTVSAVLPPLSPGLSAAPEPRPSRLPSSVSRASARLRQVLDAQAEAQRDAAGADAAADAAAAVECSSDSNTSYATAWSQAPCGLGAAEEPRASPDRMRLSSSTGALPRLAGAASPTPAERPLRTENGGGGSPPGLLMSQSWRRPFGPEGPAQTGEPVGALQVVRAYHDLPVPAPGQELEFRPDGGLQPVHFLRQPLAAGGLGEQHRHRTAAAAAEAEAAAGLRGWAVVALCRCLSLDNILLLLTAVLLEQQTVLFCPNIGLLSAATLALLPLARPFAWQSLLLPVLPASDSMLDLLEAPVPFILGVQYKTSEVAARCASLIRVNVYKDRIKNAERLPQLPGRPALRAMLQPAHELLQASPARARPAHDVSGGERQAAEDFLQTTEAYLRGLCSRLHLHSITDVQTPDRVSLLLKDSFVESFEPRDRGFMRAFVETQMFSVHCDTVM